MFRVVPFRYSVESCKKFFGNYSGVEIGSPGYTWS
jgi:hypothetical protein